MTMINIILGLILEVFISFVYFEKKFTPKISNTYIRIALYILSFFVLFGISFIGVSNVNLIAFLLFNLVMCFFCYESKFALAVFNSILLASILIVTELFVFYISQFAYWSGVLDYISNDCFVVIQSLLIRLLYFLIIFVILLLSSKEKNVAFKFTMSTFLLLLPVASIMVLTGIVRMTEIYTADSYIYASFGVAALLLLYAYMVIFGVYESVVKTQKENTQLQLQIQKSEIDAEYYNILQDQYENSNILIHDIKHHLLSIKNLSSDNDCNAINRYIDNLYEEYQIKYIRRYSSNRLVNAIINRYAMFCKDNGIDFYCDIRDIDFSFISDNNLTAVLDNLLENAVEAALDSSNKVVELTVKYTNVNFVAINIWNSCSVEPDIKDGKFVTTKKDKDIHGFGVKSIERIVKEYQGNMDYSFDKDKMMFTFSIVFNVNSL